jgi:hypothetical protein
MISGGVTGEGASHDQTSTPAVAPTTFFGFSGLPQELKDEIHELVLMDKVGDDGAVEIMGTDEEPSGYGDWRTKVSLWAFTKASEPLHDKGEFVAASATLKRFLRRHTKFKVTCAHLDSSEAKKAWSRYTELEVLLSPSSPFRNSFSLVVKGRRWSQSDVTLESAVWFFWEAMKRWHQQTGKRPGMMLLRRIELPRTDVMNAVLDSSKLQALLRETFAVPGLPANPNEFLAIVNKFCRMVEITGEKISLEMAIAIALLAQSQ